MAVAKMIFGNLLTDNLKELIKEMQEEDDKEKRESIGFIVRNILEVAEQTAKEYCLVLEK